MNEQKLSELKHKLLQLKHKSAELFQIAAKYPYKQAAVSFYKKVKTFRWKKLRIPQRIKKATRWISASWKIVLTSVFSFLLFYYSIGSLLVENMDVSSGYALPKEPSDKFETANTMAFLINREIDSKMWTPNLPIAFPAYVLDNMPNFQIGIIESVRDTTATLRKFKNNTPAQITNAVEAYTLLRYSPRIWLLSRKGTFGIAPSSNAQYRKARKELIKFNKNGNFVPTERDFDLILAKISRSLRKLSQKSDMYVQEYASDWFDTQADDLFHHHRGYAFGLWQIAEALGFDFKNIILQKDLYNEWTYLISSLKKAAEFNPWLVRNEKADSMSANHLIVQNYYLQRAQTAIERIRCMLLEEKNAD